MEGTRTPQEFAKSLGGDITATLRRHELGTFYLIVKRGDEIIARLGIRPPFGNIFSGAKDRKVREVLEAVTDYASEQASILDEHPTCIRDARRILEAR